MQDYEALKWFIYLLGAVTALWALIRTTRRVVHVADAIEAAAIKQLEAADLIIHEFKVNGGRQEHPISSNEEAAKATVKDLMMDQRTLLHRIAANQTLHDDQAEARADRIIAEVRPR